MKRHIKDFNRFSLNEGSKLPRKINEEMDIEDIYDILIEAIDGFNNQHLEFAADAFGEWKRFEAIQDAKVSLVESIIDKLEKEIKSGAFSNIEGPEDAARIVKEIASRRRA
jgi:hypothetical protein